MLDHSSHKLLQMSLNVVRSLLYPSYFSFNALTSLYYITFEEQKQERDDVLFLKKIFLTPVYGILFLLCFPLMCLFLPLRCFLINFRRPYVFSENQNCLQQSTKGEVSKNYEFAIGSANICLMPELLSRMNHLTSVDCRSEKIGKRILEDQLSSSRHDSYIETTKFNGTVKHHSDMSNGCSKTLEVSGDVSKSFPQMDFLCIQEAWSSYHNGALISYLHEWFPFIVHDIGTHSFSVNRFVLGSGHLIASRHPMEAIKFKAFDNFVRHGKIISLGLTMVKVILGPAETNGRNVAYIFNTHLQSYEGKDKVIAKQLDEILSYTEEFIEENNQAADNIAFCLLCGDFNMDNLSPADYSYTRHRFFNRFQDFGRLEPGIEKSWAVGTELRQDRMMDAAVCTPEGLKSALDDPALRQCYILDGDITEHCHEELVYATIKMDDDGNVRVVPEGGRRRIDYVTCDKKYPVEVKGYHFVTKLAGLTDHIPLAMEFTCPNLQ